MGNEISSICSCNENHSKKNKEMEQDEKVNQKKVCNLLKIRFFSGPKKI
jgi:hypothetical protein